MKLLFKERMFSWFDSYDIFNESGETVFVVKGALSFGHLLKIYNADGEQVGEIAEKIFTFLPKFEMYEDGEYIGCIKKEFTFFVPRFSIDGLGWEIAGDIFDWDYQITDNGMNIASVTKQVFNWTDTYEIDISDGISPLHVLMTVLAIDAEKCSSNN